LVLALSGIRTVTVGATNPFFRLSGDFLVDCDGHSLVRYLGNEGDLAIGSGTVVISAGCFSGCGSVLSVRFEGICQISTIGEAAFASCVSICIPSSIETTPSFCFNRCQNL
jgi:hypothetical protein